MSYRNSVRLPSLSWHATETETVQRPPLAGDWSEREQLRAEHGYALLLAFQ